MLDLNGSEAARKNDRLRLLFFAHVGNRQDYIYKAPPVEFAQCIFGLG